MSKQLFVDPNEMRAPGYIHFEDIPCNQYRKTVKDELGNFTTEQLINIYRDMLTLREFETMINEIKINGKYNGVSYNHPGPAHLSIGEEAAAVGEAFHMTVDDLIFGSHRAHSDILAKGLSAIEKLSDDELMKIMKELVSEGKSILFITHKLNEIKAVADRCTVLRKGRYIGTVDVASTTKEEMSEMMVGRKVNLNVEKTPAQPGEVVLSARGVCVKGHGGSKNVVDHVDFDVRRGEIVCIAGIDGNGQTELVYALTGLVEPEEGTVTLNGQDITHAPIRRRNAGGLGHIPEDRHRHGLVLDYNLAYNLVLQSYFEPEFCSRGFLKYDAIYEYADKLIGKFDIRSGQGARTITRSMSGGNQQKAIVAREIDRDPDVLIAVQPTRGLDVGAIEYIHGKLVEERDAGKAILLVSLELDEVMQLSDRILVIYEGRIVADLDPKTVTVQELGLYMAGSGRRAVQ